MDEVTFRLFQSSKFPNERAKLEMYKKSYFNPKLRKKYGVNLKQSSGLFKWNIDPHPLCLKQKHLMKVMKSL